MARGAGNYGLGPIYYYLFPIISKEESYISRCKTLCDGGKRANIIARLPLGSRENPSSPSRLLLFFCARPRRPEAVERASSLALPSLTRTTYELASVGIGFLSI